MNLFAKCQECEDTGWVKHPAGGMVRCGKCNPRRPAATPPERGIIADSDLHSVKDELGDCKVLGKLVDSGVRIEKIPADELEPMEYEVALIIAGHEESKPVKIREITDETGLDERSVKGICRTLRDKFLLPIGASRRPPAGIYWITTKEGFLRYYETTRSQALSELVTLNKMAKRHFPELAGQLSIVECRMPIAE